MASKEIENGLENKLTITFPSNTSHKSLSTEPLVPLIYSNSSLEFTELKLSNRENFLLNHSPSHCLPSHTNQPTA